MPLDIYSTAAQLRALELMPREYTFLADTFLTDMGAVEDSKAIYDYMKGSQRMAPIVHPGTGGVLMGRDGYETLQIGFCTIAPERIIQNNDLTGRAFGETIMGAMTPEQREKKMLAKDLMDMRKAIARRIEWMVRQVLLFGKLEVFRYTNEGRDKYTTLVADYNFTNTYTPATPWNQTGAKIDYDMRKAFDLVYNGLGVADIVVMDPDAADAMLENEGHLKIYDLKNLDMGEINTRYVGQGVRFLGYNSDGVPMFSFAGRFVDDLGVSQPILPSGTVLIGGKGMLKCPFGPVTQVEDYGSAARHKTYIKKEVPLRYGSIDGNSIKNRLTSCPTVVPFNVDAWVKMNVL